MISRSLLLSFLSLAFAFSAHAEAKRYLVQFKSSGKFQAQRLVLNTHAKVTDNLNNINMMVVESDDALSMQMLKSNPDIAIVEEEIFHAPPRPIIARQRAKTHELPVAAVHDQMEMPWGIKAVNAPQAWNTTRGAGARVMVLDTGIDQGHPALAGQIEAVQNFTGGDANDVTDEVGHGSHVSGTIAANGLNGGLVGVAPEAKLLMGKVCTPIGCSNIAIASGLNWAVQQKVDVVSMSLGGPIMTPAEGAAVQSCEDNGVLVVAASGNDGKAQVSYPAAAPTAFAVGAVDETLAKADFSNWGPQLAIMGPGVDVISSVPRGTGREAAIQVNDDGKGLQVVNSMAMSGTPSVAAVNNDLVFCNLGDKNDFPPEVKGKFALINRGTIAFADKVTNAIAAGAAGVLIANNAPGLIVGTVVATEGTEVAIPAVMIEQSVGAAAQAALAAGTPVNATIAVNATDYASFEGTSMATPHVSGVAALVRAANKTLTPAQVRTILKSTATALTPNDQNQMGAGIVNAEAAVANAGFLPLRQVAN